MLAPATFFFAAAAIRTAPLLEGRKEAEAEELEEATALRFGERTKANADAAVDRRSTPPVREALFVAMSFLNLLVIDPPTLLQVVRYFNFSSHSKKIELRRARAERKATTTTTTTP